jgi:hypothetical protein
LGRGSFIWGWCGWGVKLAAHHQRKNKQGTDGFTSPFTLTFSWFGNLLILCLNFIVSVKAIYQSSIPTLPEHFSNATNISVTK